MLKTLVASIFSVIIVFLAAFFYLSSPSSTEASHILGHLEFRGYALSPNIGWVSLSCANINDGVRCSTDDEGDEPVVNYQVEAAFSGIPPERKFSGYGWSSNIGWINFAPTSGYPGSPNHAAKLVVLPPTPANSARCESLQEVQGWIRALSYGGGWDGWIKMSGNATDGSHYGVCLTPNGESLGGANNTDKRSGYAWGSDVVGWIEFNPAFNDTIDANKVREIPPR